MSRVLPASSLRGLNPKQIASLSKPKVTGKGSKAAKAPAAKTGKKARVAKRASHLHTPRLLPQAVAVSFAPTVVRLTVGGVPENWANARYVKAVHMKRYTAPWRKLVNALANQARVMARLPLQDSPHPKRQVAIMIYRCAPMFDPDGVYTVMKPVVDALKRVLLYDDSATYLGLLVEQTRISTKADQRIEITISGLPDPN